MKEFRVHLCSERVAYEWMVSWDGCDGRVVAYCSRRYEADGIARALNAARIADKWYKRARVGLGLAELHGGKR